MFRSLPEMVVVAPRPKKRRAKKVFGDRRGLGFRHLVVKPANLGHVLFYRQRKPFPKPKHGKFTFNRGSLGFRPIQYWPVPDNGIILLFRQRKPFPKPKHGKKFFGKASIGFWPVPDIGAAGQIAVTLPFLQVAGVAQLAYPITGSVTLPFLSVYGEVRYGPDDNPGRVTLPFISVAGSLVVEAPIAATHSIFWKYNARDGGPIASWVKTYSGSRQIQIKRTVPAGAVSQEVDIALSSSTTVALTLYSTQAVSVVLNDDHSQTISLAERVPIIWTAESGDDFPFTSDVVKLFVSNPGTSDSSFTISALILDHSN